jgi:DNA invertase Pin-like site-specific DNA recombinase
VLHIMGALAEFERALIVERTRAGLSAAKRCGNQVARGRYGVDIYHKFLFGFLGIGF